MPSEMACGRSPTKEIVQDYIDERLYIEARRGGSNDARSPSSVIGKTTVGRSSTVSETENTESERTEMLDWSTLDYGTISEQLGVDEQPITTAYRRRTSFRPKEAWRTN